MYSSEKRGPAGAQPAAATSQSERLKFNGENSFQTELRRRIEAYMQSTGKSQRDCPRMYAKTGIILGVFAASYILLVFFAATWWQTVPLAILLGLSAAAIGFNVMHDGGHKAYSKRAWINRLMGVTAELIGGSSYVWHWKHGVFHHTYANITGYDTDIDMGGLARFTPHQKRLLFHRWQHWYVWFLYGLMAVKWHLYDDFRDVILGRMDGHTFPRPKGRDLAVFLGGKVSFLLLAFGIPLLFHAVWEVALFYGIAVVVLGVVLSMVFQLAHCVEEADFPVPGESGRMETSWGIHQVETTVDFARRSRLAGWLLGGLNYQIEHHLFSRICHVNYPAISKLVEETCHEFGVRYAVHDSLLAGLRSHFRWLRRMGRPSAAA